MNLMDSLMDWDVKRSELQARRDEISRLTIAVAPKCGNCRLWMTSKCVPEKQGGHFKSASSSPCPLFAEKEYVSEMRARASVLTGSLSGKQR